MNNPGAVTVRANLHLEVRAVVPRRLAIELDGRVVATRDLDNSRREIYVSDLRLPPGRTVLTLAAEAAAGTGGDARSLAVALYRFDLRAVALAE